MQKSVIRTVWNLFKQLVSSWWHWAQRCSFGMVLLLFWGSLQTASIAQNQSTQSTALPAEQLSDLYSLLSWLFLTVLLGLPLLIALMEVLIDSLTKKKSKSDK